MSGILGLVFLTASPGISMPFTGNYVDVFVRENLARVMTLRRRYDVRKVNTA